MKTKLGKGMPCGELEQEVHDDHIIVGFKQAIENGNQTLKSHEHMTKVIEMIDLPEVNLQNLEQQVLTLMRHSLQIS